MSKTIDQAIGELNVQIAALDEDMRPLKKLVNELCRLDGMRPLYSEVEEPEHRN